MNVTPILAAETVDNIWSALPSFLWVALIVAGFVIFRSQFTAMLTHLNRRLRAGAPVKLGTVELGAIRTSPRPLDSSVSAAPSSAAAVARQKERDGLYAEARGVMLVHQLFRSDTPGQHYDILIYVIPHKDSPLVQVTKVEYFLGHFWGNEVFTSTDRAHGFSLLTSAYGSFLCTAHVYFNDGTFCALDRYIDFEMGAYAPFLENDDG